MHILLENASVEMRLLETYTIMILSLLLVTAASTIIVDFFIVQKPLARSLFWRRCEIFQLNCPYDLSAISEQLCDFANRNGLPLVSEQSLVVVL
jgi:hypothetical protein